MKKKIKLGIIGLSEGNGHPYSWSAIFNGYNEEEMAKCPFPGIPEYLSKQNYPEDFLGELAEVTHIWTQDISVSNSVARAAKIEYVVKKMEDMIGHVDAILLSRDDAENHVEMAQPFLEAGLPIFIDKPFALSLSEANYMLSIQKDDFQIFTCSSLRFAEELLLTADDKLKLGEIKYVEASVMKYWQTYAVHLIEPIIFNTQNRGEVKDVHSIRLGDIQQTLISWENLSAYLKITGNNSCPLEFKYFGENGNFIVKQFKDSYRCFRASLKAFIHQVNQKQNCIKREETLEIVSILEWGKI